MAEVVKCAQVKQLVAPKNAEFLLHMLTNADNNAEFMDLDVDFLVIKHLQVNSPQDVTTYNLQRSCLD